MGERPPKVLVADDVQTTALAAQETLERGGFDVLLARDGREAVRLTDSEDVDLALLDLEMPTMDGLQALRLIKSAPTRGYLPVLMMTVRDDHEKRVAAFKLGADDFLVKPLDAEELVARVRRSITLRRRFQELAGQTVELHRKSITDGLKEEFRRAQRYDDPLALVLLDIDEFKMVNERFGHQEGDRVLRLVADAMRRSLRETDVTSRYGGEEFAMLLPKTHLAGALTVAERVWKDVGGLRAGPGGLSRVTASLGISGYPNRSVFTSEQLFRTADDALYRAKREGRNKICLYQQATLFGSEAPAT
jgi:diguanylate cyclase (GGDEF)-like protein